MDTTPEAVITITMVIRHISTRISMVTVMKNAYTKSSKPHQLSPVLALPPLASLHIKYIAKRRNDLDKIVSHML